MKYEYSPPRLKKEYEDELRMKKKYGIEISLGMTLFLDAVNASLNAYDLISYRFFMIEHLKGNLKNYYSLSLDKKKSKWRILIQMLDEEGNVLIPSDNEIEFLKSVRRIRIRELSEHYVEY